MIPEPWSGRGCWRRDDVGSIIMNINYEFTMEKEWKEQLKLQNIHSRLGQRNIR